jgi:hypothetical protein
LTGQTDVFEIHRREEGGLLGGRRPLWLDRAAANPVQQRSTATVEPEPDPDELRHASGQRTRLHQTLLHTVHTEEVTMTGHYQR